MCNVKLCVFDCDNVWQGAEPTWLLAIREDLQRAMEWARKSNEKETGALEFNTSDCEAREAGEERRLVALPVELFDVLVLENENRMVVLLVVLVLVLVCAPVYMYPLSQMSGCRQLSPSP